MLVAGAPEGSPTPPPSGTRRGAEAASVSRTPPSSAHRCCARNLLSTSRTAHPPVGRCLTRARGGCHPSRAREGPREPQSFRSRSDCEKCWRQGATVLPAFHSHRQATCLATKSANQSAVSDGPGRPRSCERTVTSRLGFGERRPRRMTRHHEAEPRVRGSVSRDQSAFS